MGQEDYEVACDSVRRGWGCGPPRPESMGRLARWVADNPLYMRLDGMVGIALGLWLTLRQYREEHPPRPRWQRRFGR